MKRDKIYGTSDSTTTEAPKPSSPPPPSASVPKSKLEQEKSLDQFDGGMDEDEEDSSIMGALTKYRWVIVGIVVVIIVVVVVVIATRGTPEVAVVYTPPPTLTPMDTPAPLSEADRIRQELERQGVLGGYNPDALDQRYVESDTLFDLTGKDIPELWTMKSSESYTIVAALISYTKHRAVLAPGVELYWIEGDWNGLPVKFTIQYRDWRALPASGSMAIDIEVVETTDGALIATCFAFNRWRQADLINR
jgi:hypothetical protein